MSGFQNLKKFYSLHQKFSHKTSRLFQPSLNNNAESPNDNHLLSRNSFWTRSIILTANATNSVLYVDKARYTRAGVANTVPRGTGLPASTMLVTRGPRMMSIITYININSDNIIGNLKIFLFQKCVSNWYPLALLGSQEVALSYIKVGDPCTRALVPNRWVATPKWVVEEFLWGREQQPQ